MNQNNDFYVLQFAAHPGLYYCDSQFGVTDNLLLAERYSSPEEALKFKYDLSKWQVCRVHLEVEPI